MGFYQKWINDNKTIICSIIVMIIQAFKMDIPENIYSALLGIFLLLGGGSAAHHIQKQAKQNKSK